MNEHAAFRIAVNAHDGQTYGAYTDKEEPYIWHVIRVAQAVGGTHPQYRGVALLHDVLEDCPDIDQNYLKRETGMSDDEEVALWLLTRTKDMTYMEYVDRIAKAQGEAGEIARVVKRADLAENKLRMTSKMEGLLNRYSRAQEILR